MKSKMIFLFIISFLLFLSAQIIRIYGGNYNIIGDSPYGLTRVSQIFMSGSNYDPLAYQGHEVVYFPLHLYILGIPAVVLSVDTYFIASFIGPLVGAISSLIFYGIIKEFGFKNRVKSTLVFIMIPVSVYLFSHSGSRGPSFMLSLMAFYLYLKGKRVYPLFLLISSMSHPITTSFFFLAILLWSFFQKNLRKEFKMLTISIMLVVAPYIIQIALIGPPTPNILHYEYSIEARSTLHMSTIFEIVSFIPNDPYSALSLPILVFAFYALYRSGDRYLMSIIVVSLALTFALQRFRVYLIFPFALACARIMDSVDKKWSMVFLFSLIPFAISTSIWMSTLGPDQCFVSLMPDSSDSSETILSNWQVGHRVESLANKKVFMDGTAEYVPEVDRRFGDFVSIFTSDNSSYVNQIVESNDIDYILVLDSDDYYFGQKGLEVNIENHGFEILKQESCGKLLKT